MAGLTANTVPKASDATHVADSLLTENGTTLAYNTNKFTVTAANGNSLVAGTLSVTSNFAVNTNKFNVTASSGNTTIAGTLDVTGALTAPSFSSSGSGAGYVQLLEGSAPSLVANTFQIYSPADVAAGGLAATTPWQSVVVSGGNVVIDSSGWDVETPTGSVFTPATVAPTCGAGILLRVTEASTISGTAGGTGRAGGGFRLG